MSFQLFAWVGRCVKATVKETLGNFKKGAGKIRAMQFLRAFLIFFTAPATLRAAGG